MYLMHLRTSPAGDLVILVPYVGQLFRVQRCLEAAQLRLLVSERDREQMERAGGAAEGEEGDGEGGKAGGLCAVVAVEDLQSSTSRPALKA